MMLMFLWLSLGLIILVQGANWLVSGASALARQYQISDLVIGLTIVAFGTSAPELIVNIFSSLKGYQDLAVANVLGSNIFNLFMILGLAGMISPLVVQSTTIWNEIPLSLLAVLILLLLTNVTFLNGDPGLSRLDGMFLLVLFGLFLAYVFRQQKADSVESETDERKLSGPKIWMFIILGLLGLVAGGELLVRNAVELARMMGVEEKIIGLTIVAAGTSLPELATSVVAAIKKNNDIAVGNIIGSNIFNILLILGMSSVIRPISYDPQFNREILILCAGTVFLFVAMFTGKRQRLDRWEAAILFLGFTVYTMVLIWGSVA